MTSCGFHPVPVFTGALVRVIVERTFLLRELLRSLVPLGALIRIEAAADAADVFQALAGLHADQQRRERAGAAARQKRGAAHHELLLAMTFDLEPVLGAVAGVGRIDLLGDEAFEMLIADARRAARRCRCGSGPPGAAALSRVVWRMRRRAGPCVRTAARRAGPRRGSRADRRCRTAARRAGPVPSCAGAARNPSGHSGRSR